MKTIITAALVGLISSASYGAAATSATELLSQIKGGQITGTIPSGVAQYQKDVDAQNTNDYNQLTAIHKAKGYDPTVASVIQAADALSNGIKSNTDTIVNASQDSANKLAQIQSAITFLNQYTPPAPTTAPGYCAINSATGKRFYTSNPATGDIQSSGGVYKFTDYKTTQTYLFATNAGNSAGEQINPPVGKGVTVYFAPEAPNSTNMKNTKVQCF